MNRTSVIVIFVLLFLSASFLLLKIFIYDKKFTEERYVVNTEVSDQAAKTVELISEIPEYVFQISNTEGVFYVLEYLKFWGGGFILIQNKEYFPVSKKFHDQLS